MFYSTISHTHKPVTFKSGTKADEFYYHIKSKNLIMNYSNEFLCVMRCKAQIEKSGIGKQFLTSGMNFGEISWNTALGWHNYTLTDLIDSMLKELAENNHGEFGLGEHYDKWSAAIRTDGIYLNFRIYEERGNR